MGLSFGLGLPPAPKKGVGALRFTTSLPASVSYSRTGAATALTVAGVVVPFAANAAPITDRGMLLEPAATNILQNSGLAGGATPTNWEVGFETGTGSVGTSAVIPSNANRTCTVGVGNRQFIQKTISLAANTTYTVSIDVEAVSGTADGFFAYASGLPAGASATTISAPTSTGRKTFTITVGATAGSALIRVGLGTSTAVTVAGSVTWSNPQVEAGTVATSRITTPVGGTATRGLPASSVTVPSGKTVARVTYGLSSTVTDITGLTPGATFDLVTGRAWVGLGNELKTLEWRP